MGATAAHLLPGRCQAHKTPAGWVQGQAESGGHHARHQPVAQALWHVVTEVLLLPPPGFCEQLTTPQVPSACTRPGLHLGALYLDRPLSCLQNQMSSCLFNASCVQVSLTVNPWPKLYQPIRIPLMVLGLGEK